MYEWYDKICKAYVYSLNIPFNRGLNNKYRKLAVIRINLGDK
jgi:hypothetical protein